MSVEAINKKPGGGASQLPPDWQTMPHGIRVGRYTDPGFLQLEYEKLWSQVWQVACRVDAIPEPDDYTVYEIGERSVFVVRVDAGTIRAYHNFCPHRGTALADGQGAFEHGNIICPFHGWRWNTEGENQYVLAREEFKQGKLEASDVGLKQVHCVEYQGMVFINFADDPQPFDEFIAPISDLMEKMIVGEMRHYWWKKIDVPANWKTAQEAFFEGYHVPATHPQLEPDGADFIYGETLEGDFHFAHHNVAYDAFDRGHGRFYAGKNTAMQGQAKIRQAPDGEAPADPVDAMADRLQLLVDGMDAQVLQPDVDTVRALKGVEIPGDSSLGAEYIRALYTEAAQQERPMPPPVPEALEMWGGEIFLFPNICMLFHAGNMMMYRAMPHPTDPNQCTFEIFSTRTLPAAAPRERAEQIHVTDMNDPEQVYEIPRQDLGNIPRLQRGMRTGAMKQSWLASYNEKIILNMHQELDRYIAD